MIPHPSWLRQGPEFWQRLAVALCILFGSVFLLNIHPVGDGLWFWYAIAMRHGQKLYTDLHVPMQPLFFFLTEWNQRLFGETWLASKALALVQVVVYATGLLLVSRRIPWSDRAKAVLIVSVFGLTIMASYSRFDDFHITEHIMVVYSIWLLLCIQDGEQRRSGGERKQGPTRDVVLLGVCVGLAIANRLNDGGMLLLTTALCLYLFLRKLTSVLLLFATSGFVLSCLILLTGNSFPEWFTATVVRAAGIKGGGRMISYPFHFPFAMETVLSQDAHLLRDVFYFGALLALVCYGVYFQELQDNPYRRWVVAGCRLASLGIGLILLQQSLSGDTVLAFALVAVILTYILFTGLSMRLFHRALTSKILQWNRAESLLLIPFGQLVAGATTSGESYLEAYASIAFLLLLFPLIMPSVLEVRGREKAFLVCLCLLGFGSLLSKTEHPYYWHHYNDRALFVDRQWYQHPKLGPLYIEKPQLALMTQLCTRMAKSSGRGDMLAMPWPYPNYFCNVAPWHGYVQTWYDTTSPATIEQLIAALKQDPPEWIVYQRGLDMIRMNEVVFNNGKPLAHRALDQVVIDKLQSGKWILTWQSCFGGTDWLLIHARSVSPGETGDTLIPSDDHVNLCLRTSD